MNIDTEFNVGDSVCYLSGDNICHSTISKITIEISYTDRSFLMVYKLSDGLSVPRNNYPQWDKRLFRNKKSLIKYYQNHNSINMKESEYCIGDFLYGIPSSKESEMYNPTDKRVFIYNGCMTGDGYGILVGWHDGQIKKSTGFKNFVV